EPFAYIADVTRKIAEGWPNSRIGELMPWQWTAETKQIAA
ncbi:transposase domain-containing protein, partial [Bosea sp. 2YAB26]